MMSMRPGRLAVAVLITTAPSCRAIIGSLDECSRDADCAGKAAVPVCRQNLCVSDPRCSTYGSSDPSALSFPMVLPITTLDGGPGAGYAQILDAVEMTVDELNPPKRSGLGGRPLRAILCDNGEDSTVSGQMASVFVANGLPVIMTDGSSDVINVSGAAIPADVLTLSGSSFSPEITGLAASPRGVRLVWRTTASDSVVMKALAAQLASMADGGAPPVVAAFARDDAYGQADLAAFKLAYPGVTQSYLFQPGGVDVTNALASASAASPAPQVKTIFGFQDDYVAILNTAEDPSYASLIAAPWYFTQGGRFPTLQSALARPSRVVGTLGMWTLQHIDSTAYAWLQTNLGQKYGFDPSAVQYVPNVADEVMLYAIAVGVAVTAQQPLTGTQLAQTLGRVSAVDGGLLVPLDPPDYNTAVSELVQGHDINIEGASGHLDFDSATGEAPASVEIWQVTATGFQTVAVLPP